MTSAEFRRRLISSEAVIDAKRLDHDHQLERERIRLLSLAEASRGLVDVAEGKVKDAQSTLAAIRRRRATKSAGS